MSECGTYAGYGAHIIAGTKTCAACRKAMSDYMREWRARSPKYAAQVAQQSLRDRALRILGQRHQTELRKIIEEIRAELPRGESLTPAERQDRS